MCGGTVFINVEMAMHAEAEQQVHLPRNTQNTREKPFDEFFRVFCVFRG